ncbi:tetratricopeptide repeat protein [bacterium]|nr:tetratricopeptide repeat protein [bacterium]
MSKFAIWKRAGTSITALVIVMLAVSCSSNYSSVKRMLRYGQYEAANDHLSGRSLYSAEGYALKAEALFYMEQYADMIESCRQSLQYGSRFRQEIRYYLVSAHIIVKGNLSKTYNRDDYEKTIEYAHILQSIDKLLEDNNLIQDYQLDSDTLNYYLADSYFQTEQLDSSQYYYESIVSYSKNNKYILEKLGTIYYKQRNYDRCLSISNELLENYGNHENALVWRASCLEATGDTIEALNAYIYAIDRLSSENKAIMTKNVGVLLFTMQEWRRAIPFLENTLAAFPADAAAIHLMVGESAFNLKDYRAARSHFTRALEQNPQDYNAMRYLGLCHWYGGDEKRARELFATAEKLKSNTGKSGGDAGSPDKYDEQVESDTKSELGTAESLH